MPKTAACWVGRHSWTTNVVQGESVKVCSACGKIARDTKGDPDAHTYDHKRSTDERSY